MNRWWGRRWLLRATVAVLASTGLGAASRAADLPPAPTAPLYAPTPTMDLIDPYRWELRGGVFAHGVGSVEEKTVDLNAEFVTPRILPWGRGEWWSIFVPRVQVGGMANLGGRTSYAYAGGLWTIPLFYGFFTDFFFGGAYAINATLVGSPTQVALGCNPLFHVGGEVGYAFTANWHAMVTFDHISDGNNVFGTNCTRNQGINDWGAKISYSF